MALSDGGETLQALVRRNAGLSAAVIRASQRQGIAEVAPGGLHQGAERRTNSSPSSSLVHLIVQHYSASSDARQKDLDRALLLNAAWVFHFAAMAMHIRFWSYRQGGTLVGALGQRAHTA